MEVKCDTGMRLPVGDRLAGASLYRGPSTAPVVQGSALWFYACREKDPRGSAGDQFRHVMVCALKSKGRSGTCSCNRKRAMCFHLLLLQKVGTFLLPSIERFLSIYYKSIAFVECEHEISPFAVFLRRVPLPFSD